jgi:hypothetical protein
MRMTNTTAERDEILQEIVLETDCMRHHIELMMAGVRGHGYDIAHFARRIADLSADLDKIDSETSEYRAPEVGWRPAFYDTAYDRDQTERAMVFNDVVGFLLSIDCRPRWSAGYDGSGIDNKYGIYISDVTYRGKTFDHNPCYQVDYELPADLIKKLDERFPPPAQEVPF